MDKAGKLLGGLLSSRTAGQPARGRRKQTQAGGLSKLLRAAKR